MKTFAWKPYMQRCSRKTSLRSSARITAWQSGVEYEDSVILFKRPASRYTKHFFCPLCVPPVRPTVCCAYVCVSLCMYLCVYASVSYNISSHWIGVLVLCYVSRCLRCCINLSLAPSMWQSACPTRQYFF